MLRNQRVSMIALLALAVLVCLQQQQPTLTVAAAVPMRSRQRDADDAAQCGGLNGPWLDAVWSAYKEKYQRSYSTDEDSVRKPLFVKNVWMLAKHSVEQKLGLHTHEIDFNDFSDWLPQPLLQKWKLNHPNEIIQIVISQSHHLKLWTNEELSGLYGVWPNESRQQS